ncbi:MAG: phosphoglycolate phosphatase [Rhodocyclaceae bacterium]
MLLSSPVEAVLIDLDGTLLDTVPDLAPAADAMLGDLGLPPIAASRVREFVGKGIPNLVRRCLAEAGAPPDAATAARALDAFRRHYAAVNGRHTTVYPGVIEGLDALRARGLALGCVTNKAEAFARPLLAMKGLAGYFAALVCGDTLPQAKPDPAPLLYLCRLLGAAPAGTVHIGDSENDVRAARAAGIRVLLVPYGYGEGRDVHDLDCDAIVAGLEEAARLIARIESHRDSGVSEPS